MLRFQSVPERCRQAIHISLAQKYALGMELGNKAEYDFIFLKSTLPTQTIIDTVWDS